MHSEFTPTFSHNKKISFFLFFSFSISVAITAAPLFLIKSVDPEKSLLMMFFIELFFSFLVYIALLRHFPIYHLVPERRPTFIRTTFILLILITLIQIIVYLYNSNFYHYQTTQLNFISLILLIFIIPFYEEIFYRGCLFGFLCSVCKKNLIIPGIITSLMFCIMHTQYLTFLYQTMLFIISSMLIYIRVKTKSLAYPMILHSCMNALVVFLNVQSLYR